MLGKLMAAGLRAAALIPVQPAAAQNPFGGAAVAAQGTRYRNGYYGYDDGCWLHRRDGGVGPGAPEVSLLRADQ